MSRRIHLSPKMLAPAHNNAARSKRRAVTMGKRARISSAVLRGPYLPPEDWHESRERLAKGNYCVIQHSAGAGFRHVLTEADVRQRLAQLPAWMIETLEVVQFSRMTRKKLRSPCYGMQWGSTIYLYPIEETLVETFCEPPKPAQRIEASMYGAHWSHAGDGAWQLIWTEEAVRDFYLNNVLIHELGHILDNRNTSTKDRERFAEWFALEMGYKPAHRVQLAQRAVSKYTQRHAQK
jgi:hypothetical protein